MEALQLVPTLALAWSIWGLISELLLAVTHIKVLLCIGKPYPAKELSSKRCTYFVYDLLSPWLATAALVTAITTSDPGSTAGCSNSVMKCLAGSTAISDMSRGVNTTTAQTCPANFLFMPQNTSSRALQHPYAAIPPGTSLHHHSSLGSSDPPVARPATSSVAYSNSSKVLVALQQLLPPALQSLASEIAAALLLLVLGHAVLHIYYVVTWHKPHSRNVIEMSASTDMASRLQRFRALEVVWFVAGTSYDILTHIMVSGLLLQSVLLRSTALHA